jgi:hypothetical protein
MSDLDASWEDGLFGDWQTNDAIAKRMESDAAPQPSLWVMDLPADAQSASQHLAQQQSQLQHEQREIALAAQRLAAFADGWEPNEAATSKALGLESEIAPSPESKLAATLALANQPQAKGLLDDPLQAARAEFDRFVERVRELTSSYAHIETKLAGRAIGLTVVGWMGDFKSAWDGKVSVEQIALHRQNVRLALARRAMLVKLLIVVSTGAAKIALRLATPGAQLLVIPAVWQFVKDVIAQIQALNTATPT